MGEDTICQVNKQPVALVFNEIMIEKKLSNGLDWIKFLSEFHRF